MRLHHFWRHLMEIEIVIKTIVYDGKDSEKK